MVKSNLLGLPNDENNFKLKLLEVKTGMEGKLPSCAQTNSCDLAEAETERNLLRNHEHVPVIPDVLLDIDLNANDLQMPQDGQIYSSSPRQEAFEGGESVQLSDNQSGLSRDENRDEAIIRMKLAESVKLSNAYRTLFYGLKLNHEHNVAIVHPLAFLLRRVIYALVIIFMVDSNVVFGCLIILVTCLFMMAFVAHEAPWSDKSINVQHLINEAVFYCVCVGLMSFSGFLTEPEPSIAYGWILIALVVTLIAYNMVLILLDLLVFVRLLVYRYLKGHVAARIRQKRLHMKQH